MKSHSWHKSSAVIALKQAVNLWVSFHLETFFIIDPNLSFGRYIDPWYWLLNWKSILAVEISALARSVNGCICGVQSGNVGGWFGSPHSHASRLFKRSRPLGSSRAQFSRVPCGDHKGCNCFSLSSIAPIWGSLTCQSAVRYERAARAGYALPASA